MGLDGQHLEKLRQPVARKTTQASPWTIGGGVEAVWIVLEDVTMTDWTDAIHIAEIEQQLDQLCARPDCGRA